MVTDADSACGGWFTRTTPSDVRVDVSKTPFIHLTVVNTFSPPIVVLSRFIFISEAVAVLRVIEYTSVSPGDVPERKETNAKRFGRSF